MPGAWTMSTEDPLAVRTVAAIREGDATALASILGEHPELATVRLGSDPDGDDPGMTRSLLHVATDWPGHFPNVGETIRILVEAGADPNARFTGPHTETPLHWAASSDDVEALDTLLDLGADIEATGAVIGGGTALSDATAFGCWDAGHRLVERGAAPKLWESTALGRLDVFLELVDATSPSGDDITHAFWSACHGGQRVTAEAALDGEPTSTGSATTTSRPWRLRNAARPTRWSVGCWRSAPVGQPRSEQPGPARSSGPRWACGRGSPSCGGR